LRDNQGDVILGLGQFVNLSAAGIPDSRPLAGSSRYAKSNRDIGLRDNANKAVSIVYDRYPPNVAIRHSIERRLKVITHSTHKWIVRHHFFKWRVGVATLGYDL